jgi:putative SOS response-associated peptidase YedK
MQVMAAARVPEERWINKDLYEPSFNVTPGAYIPVLIKDADGSVAVQSMRWGLVPSYTSKDAKADFWRMFNARRRDVF